MTSILEISSFFPLRKHWKKVSMPTAGTFFAAVLVFALTSCSADKQILDELSSEQLSDSPEVVYVIDHEGLSIEFDDQLRSRVVSSLASESQALGRFRTSEYMQTTAGDLINKFAFQSSSEMPLTIELGSGRQVVLTGISDSGLQKEVMISSYPNFPLILFFKVRYTNLSDDLGIRVGKWVNNHYNMVKGAGSSEGSADFWSYEGASYQNRRGWIKPIEEGYYQENFMGMNASDYGNGTAITDLWRKDIGLAIGHVETTPKLVSLPLTYEYESIGADLRIEFEKVEVLDIGDSMETIETFVTLHEGDYYSTLRNYREVMAVKGLAMKTPPDSAYEAVWCAWGYDRDFTVDEVLATLPKAKEIGFEWAVLDDGWQTAEGDWYLDPDKFPNGDTDMKYLVDEMINADLKPKLWWAPLAVDPGTDLMRDHSDMLILDQDGAPQDVTWWDSYYLCPAYLPTREHTKEFLEKIMGEWGYRGLKIDGQHLNGVAPCYNPAHDHESPEDSVEQLAEYWKMVYETAIEIFPEAVVEICPCGTSYAFHNLPFMNQAVSSDPESSWQVRHKGKTLKGLMGESTPYYGDHVEHSDDDNDFASSVGVGAVVGSLFTAATETSSHPLTDLDAEKEASWKKWVSIYNEEMLPKGVYLGELYDIGFDRPETHAIQKDDRLYYAFYAEEWDSAVELRGLSEGTYQVYDYVNDIDLGIVEGAAASLNVEFQQYLLLELIPIPQPSLANN